MKTKCYVLLGMLLAILCSASMYGQKQQIGFTDISEEPYRRINGVIDSPAELKYTAIVMYQTDHTVTGTAVFQLPGSPQSPIVFDKFPGYGESICISGTLKKGRNFFEIYHYSVPTMTNFYGLAIIRIMYIEDNPYCEIGSNNELELLQYPYG